jgi:hypothetical protein
MRLIELAGTVQKLHIKIIKLNEIIVIVSMLIISTVMITIVVIIIIVIIIIIVDQELWYLSECSV